MGGYSSVPENLIPVALLQKIFACIRLLQLSNTNTRSHTLWMHYRGSLFGYSHSPMRVTQSTTCIFFYGSRPWQAGEACSPEGTREISRNQGSELSDATIVPQGDVVEDMTCSHTVHHFHSGWRGGDALSPGVPFPIL